MNKQQLAAKIWESANKMRSKIEANEYKDYILGFIFYKFLSETEIARLRAEDWGAEDLKGLDEDDAETVQYVRDLCGYFISYNNMFLGFNITQSPMDVIREGMANGSALLIAGAILVPVLAWFTQWLNYKLMPQAPSSNNGNKTANSMENSMKTMNTVMPVFSAFMCLSFSIGIGIYWIAGALVRSVQQVIINRHMSSIDMDEVIRKNQEKAAKKREKAGLPPQKITQAATQSVRNIQVQENEEPSAEEKEAARKASTEYYNSNQEYRAGSIAAKANMVKQFDEKNSKKKK